MNDDRFGERHRDPHRGRQGHDGAAARRRDSRSRRRRRAGRRPRRRDAQRDARLRRRPHRAGAQSRRNRGRGDRARRLHASPGGRRGSRDRSAVAGPGRQGPPRPRAQHVGRAARRQGPGRGERRLSGRKAGARDRSPAAGQPACADGHHADRRDDSNRPRTARADHRRPVDGQDDDLHRHDIEPGASQPGGGSERQRHRSAAVQHPDLLETIAREQVLSETAAAGLQTAAIEFKRTWQ